MPGTIMVSGTNCHGALAIIQAPQLPGGFFFFFSYFSIHFAVLEFMDLPLSSSTSIRASLGKLEYQMSDKGNLSFPLTSLRDDLIFKILDAEGNEISRTGVQIRLILEKGVWEDNFPLGGGHLRLKLQFILSDEERDRIRSLRQSALKKKHDELLSRGQRGAESDSSTSIGNAALPFSRNDEVSVLHLLKNLQRDTFNMKQFLDCKVLLVPAMTKNLILEM
ncbi:transcriptional regulator ATRX-like isoform X1 [Spatholobus suberectus]|nr:transcriptional regulator ATRX-like isoform X1 [Spatholobus suberectus]